MSSESIMYVQFTPFVQGDALIKFFEALENDPQNILRGIAKWQESSFFFYWNSLWRFRYEWIKKYKYPAN